MKNTIKIELNIIESTVLASILSVILISDQNAVFVQDPKAYKLLDSVFNKIITWLHTDDDTTNK